MHPPISEMNVFEAILARRSVRSYAEQEVSPAVIRTLLEAAVHAPTALHQEPQAFLVIRDRALLKRLSDVARPLFVEEARRIGQVMNTFASPDFNIFYDAGTLIIIGSVSASPFVTADCWLGAENLMLAACAMGLGTCVIGSALPALNMREVKARFGIPENFLPVAPVILGHPRGETAPTARKEPLVVAMENTLEHS